MEIPHRADDGSHVIPLYRIRHVGSDEFKEASGTLTWAANRGLSFTIEFPGVGCHELHSFYKQQSASAGCGRFSPHPPSVTWTAETAEGQAVRIYSHNETPESSETTQYSSLGEPSVSITQNSSVHGSAIYAEVDFQRQSELSFFECTPRQPRLLFAGLCLSRWPRPEEITYESGNSQIRTMRCTLQLQETPEVSLIAGGSRTGIKNSCWLAFDQNARIDLPGYPFDGERTFVNMLCGRLVPFFWLDTFPSESIVRRLYFGWSKHDVDQMDTSYTQPLPLGGTVEALQFGVDVASRLPQMFGRFIAVYRDFEFAWVLSPLWTAMSGFLDDQVALASVGLERLGNEWSRYRKKCETTDFSKIVSPWKDPRVFQLRTELGECLERIVAKIGQADPGGLAETGLEEVIEVARRRLDNIHQVPNADKLTVVFLELGLTLTDREREVIKCRNHSLHGSRTLKGSDTPHYDEEAERFDLLRMLITRAVLLILDYSGPYVNYAARENEGNFPIDHLCEQRSKCGADKVLQGTDKKSTSPPGTPPGTAAPPGPT